MTPESRARFLRAMAHALFDERIKNNAAIPFEEAFAEGVAWMERSLPPAAEKFLATQHGYTYEHALENFLGFVSGIHVNTLAAEYDRKLGIDPTKPPVDQL